MESKHTAGEWNRACDSYGKVQHSRKYDCVYTHIKGTTGGDRIITVAARIENGADANLIAAAPELLASLKSLFGYIEKGELVRDITRDAATDWAPRMAEFVMHLGKATAAIAKAEGKS